MTDLDTLSAWARCESPTRNSAAVNGMADLIIAGAEADGLAVERMPGSDGLGDLIILRAGPASHEAPIILLGHHDTVHPLGSVDGAMPVHQDGDRLYGPGTYDMKAGLLLALRGLAQANARAALRRPVLFILSPDEEIGSPTSGPIIRRLAIGAHCALVFEPARKGGGCVTARKGVARMEVTVEGVAAHSGVRHEDGRNAIAEAAHQILRIEELTDYERGVTASVGLISGGTAANTVPDHCRFMVDLRAISLADAEASVQAIQALRPVGRDTRLQVSGGIVRPPFERTDHGIALLAKAQSVAAQHGLTLPETPRTGGGSDGNFTAAMGVPTLDALGAEGDGAHTPGEYALLSSVETRQHFVADLLAEL